MKKKFIFGIALLTSVFAISCEDKDVDLGPAPVNINPSTVEIFPLKVVKSKSYSKKNPWTPEKARYEEVDKGGAIVIRWAIPAVPKGKELYDRVKVTYQINDVLVKDSRTRYASHYESHYFGLGYKDQDVTIAKKETKKTTDDSKKVERKIADMVKITKLDKGHTRIVIDNLKFRYGKIKFTITPISKTGVEGKSIVKEIQAKSLEPVPALNESTAKREIIKGDLEGDKQEAWTDSQSKKEGPLKDLFDGVSQTVDDKLQWQPKYDTYFHMSYDGEEPFPHYIVIKLDTDLRFNAKGVSFSFTGRKGQKKQSPKRIQLWGSQTFDFPELDDKGKAPKIDLDKYGAKKIGFELKDLPEGDLVKYSSPKFTYGDQKPAYLWIEILESVDEGKKFISLSDLQIYTYEGTMVNPELDGLSEKQIADLKAKGLLE